MIVCVPEMAAPEPISDEAPRLRHSAAAAAIGSLGPREREVLAVLYELGAASVQEVCDRMTAALAYTTVMTTLDRLFRKGLLRREKQGRAFIYRTTMSAKDMEGRRAADLVRRFFAESEAQPEVLIACLVDAVCGYDTDLLDRLEATIREARAHNEPNQQHEQTQEDR